jgi:hypothetical protein
MDELFNPFKKWLPYQFNALPFFNSQTLFCRALCEPCDDTNRTCFKYMYNSWRITDGEITKTRKESSSRHLSRFMVSLKHEVIIRTLSLRCTLEDPLVVFKELLFLLHKNNGVCLTLFAMTLVFIPTRNFESVCLLSTEESGVDWSDSLLTVLCFVPGFSFENCTKCDEGVL